MECHKRDSYLANTTEKDVVVEKHSVMPDLIYRTDITEDVTDWKNKGVARYYKLRSIKLE